VAGRLWAVAIFDTTSPAFVAPGSTQAAIWRNATLRTTLAAPPLSVTWWNYAAADPAIAGAAWQAALKAYPPPCLAFLDEKGKVVSAGPLPPDEPQIVALAKKVRGLQ
jgi:hypothetical protein